MCETKKCINKAFLLDEELLKNVEKIIATLPIKSRTGRPPIIIFPFLILI